MEEWQRESYTKLVSVIYDSVICFLYCGIYIKFPFCAVFLLTIEQKLSHLFFLFQGWCRTLVRWCKKASGDFAFSARALGYQKPAKVDQTESAERAAGIIYARGICEARNFGAHQRRRLGANG